MKESIIRAIDQSREAILASGEYMLKHPNLGFREHLACTAYDPCRDGGKQALAIRENFHR